MKTNRLPIIALITLLAVSSGCAALTRKADSVLLNIQTNYVPVIQIVTNTVITEVPVIKYVEKWSTRDVFVPTNGTVITNITVVTNINPIITNQFVTNIVVALETNMVASSVTVTPKSSVQALPGAVGGFFGPWGAVGAIGLAALLALYARRRQTQLNEALGKQKTAEDSAAALVQNIEVARQILEQLEKTPQGANVAAKYKEWLQAHQSAAGVIGAVGQIVADNVDPEAAKYIALKLTGKV